VSPTAPRRPCSHPGCPRLVDKANPCPEHGKRPWEHDRPSAAARGYGRAWQKLRAFILARDPLCDVCDEAGRVTPATMVDHIVPKHLGGTDDDSNLRGICKPCHDTKSALEGQASR
jgi:5-methylcytosine-specific restriction enzyme A